MVQYDPSVIREYASRLYSRAEFIIYREIFVGLFIGFAVGFGVSLIVPLSRWLPSLPEQSRFLLAVVGGIVGTLIGWAVGTDKAFALRLQAQMALCQAQIEANTRAGGVRLSS